MDVQVIQTQFSPGFFFIEDIHLSHVVIKKHNHTKDKNQVKQSKAFHCRLLLAVLSEENVDFFSSGNHYTENLLLIDPSIANENLLCEKSKRFFYMPTIEFILPTDDSGGKIDSQNTFCAPDQNLVLYSLTSSQMQGQARSIVLILPG